MYISLFRFVVHSGCQMMGWKQCTPDLTVHLYWYGVCSFRGNAQRQASSWRGNVITLLLLTGVTGLVSWMYFTWTDDLTHTLVSRSEILTQPRVFTVECSEDYKKYKFFTGMEVVIHPFTERHSLNVQTTLQYL